MSRARISLLFQLFRTSQLAHTLVSRALAPTGVRGDDYAVYSYLLQGPLTLTELADGTGLPLTTAAGYVQRFTERGHIVRTPNPEDGRSQLLSLTDEARSWVLDVAKTFTAAVSGLEDAMADAGLEFDTMSDQLDELQAVIEQALGDSG